MGETKPAKPELPGNHGQFGEGDATESFEQLEDHPSPADGAKQDGAKQDGATQGPKQTNAGERS